MLFEDHAFLYLCLLLVRTSCDAACCVEAYACCCSVPYLPAEVGDVALRVLGAVPLGSADSASPSALALEVAREAAWVLAQVTSKDEISVCPLVERVDGAVPIAVRCILSGHLPLVTPALRILGNILGLKEAYGDLALAQVCEMTETQRFDGSGADAVARC